MPKDLSGRRILILSTEYGTESDEIGRPLRELRDMGADVTVAAPGAGPIRTLVVDRDPGPEVPVDLRFAEVDPAEFDAIVLPGGTLNADQLRMDEDARRLLATVASAGRPVAAICHAPWVLIDAGLVAGVELTSVPTIATDLRNAGAEWVDAEVVATEAKGFPLITSRTPADLDAFIAAIADAIA